MLSHGIQDTAGLRPLQPQKRRDRTTDVVQAACRVIARHGAQSMTMQAVAAEANVSKTLVHYYFPSRSQLLAAAYAYAEARALERARNEIADVTPGARRLERVLRLYLDDESTIREDWILWSELSGSALFDAELTPSVEIAYRTWIAWITSLVQQGIDDGSIDPSVDAQHAGIALTAVVEGVNSLLMLRLLTRETALALMATFLEELGIGPESSARGLSALRRRQAGGSVAPHLIGIASTAADALGAIAQSAAQRSAVSRLRAALDDRALRTWRADRERPA